MRRYREGRFDTNVWLDIILSREGFWEASCAALYDCIDEDDDLCVVATSLKDVFFLVERLKSADAAYESVERMLELARPIAVDEAVCRRALPLERPDYEDGLIAAAAEIEQIECIVTRDDGAFRDLGIRRMSPLEFIKERGTEVDRSVGRGAHPCAAAAGVGGEGRFSVACALPHRTPVTFFRERGREAFRLH